MPSKSVHCALAAVLVSAPLAAASAGGKPVECYSERYHPPVYDTVRERVQIQGAFVRAEVEPAIYGTRKVRRLVSPEQVTYRVIPAVYDTVYRKVKVGGGYAWEYRRINGKLVLCKVKREATWRTVAETVVVKPARKEAVVIPAEYSYELERVVVQPEYTRVVEVPASYQVVERQVLVREGRMSWERVAIPRHCK